jgi:hypothetical protein
MRDFWRGKITPRELWVFIRHLPPDSAFFRAVDPDAAELAAYKPGDYVSMAIFDAVVGKAGAYVRPHEALEQRREQERLMALLEAQAERNRLRDQAEGVA